jgi:hypothetical protein
MNESLSLNNKIFARKTLCKEISKQKAYSFLNKYHDMGARGSICLGLYYQDNLISVATFSKSSRDKLYNWELIRYCCPQNIYILGGLSKLMKAFSKKYGGDIISYCYLGRSNGEGYKKAGFQQIGGIIKGAYGWKTPEGKIYHRIKFQKHKLKNNPYTRDFYKPELSEKEICEMAGLTKINYSDQLKFYWPPNNVPIGYVYKLTEPETGKTYIGSHTSLRGELDENYWGSSSAKNMEGWNREIICKCTSKKELIQKEIEEINKQTNTYNIKNINLIDFNNKNFLYDEESYKEYCSNISKHLKKYWEEIHPEEKEKWKQKLLEGQKRTSEERKKEKRKNMHTFWSSKTEEEMKEIVEKRKKTLSLSRTSEERKKLNESLSIQAKERYKNMTLEQKVKKNRKISEKNKERCKNMTLEQKIKISKKISKKITILGVEYLGITQTLKHFKISLDKFYQIPKEIRSNNLLLEKELNYLICGAKSEQ